MRRNIYFVLLLVMAALLFVGCATKRVEMDYGTSCKLAKFNQILEPEAGKSPEPVYGIDGQAAEKIVEKYNTSFEKPAQTMPALTLGISGGVR